MANYRQYQEPQYLTGLVLPDLNVIQQYHQDKQRRYDTAMQAYSAAAAKQDVETIDPAVIEARKQKTREDFENLFVRTGGDAASYMSEYLDFAQGITSDPVFNLNKLKMDAFKREQARREELRSQGKLLDFESVVNKPLIVGENYADPSSFTFDIEGQLPWDKDMSSVIQQNLRPLRKSGRYQNDPKDPRFLIKYDYEGIDSKQIEDKLPEMWEQYKKTDSYRQQKKAYERLDEFGMKGKDADAAIRKEFEDLARNQVTGGSHVSQQQSPEFELAIAEAKANIGKGRKNTGWLMGDAMPVERRPIQSILNTVNDYGDFKDIKKDNPLFMYKEPVERRALEYPEVKKQFSIIKDLSQSFGSNYSDKLYERIAPNFYKIVNGEVGFDIDDAISEIKNITLKLRNNDNSIKYIFEKNGIKMEGMDKSLVMSAFGQLMSGLSNLDNSMGSAIDNILKTEQTLETTFYTLPTTGPNLTDSEKADNENELRRASDVLTRSKDTLIDASTNEPLSSDVVAVEFVGAYGSDRTGVRIRVNVTQMVEDENGTARKVNIPKIIKVNDDVLFRSALSGIDARMGNLLSKTFNARFIPVSTNGKSSELIDKTSGKKVKLADDDGNPIYLSEDESGMYVLHTGQGNDKRVITMGDVFDNASIQARQMEAASRFPSRWAIATVEEQAKMIDEVRRELDQIPYRAISTYDLQNFIKLN